MPATTLGYGTSAPGVTTTGRAVDAISEGMAVQFHTTADNRIAVVPDLTNTAEKVLQIERYDLAAVFLGIALNDAGVGDWVNVCIYGPCQALLEGDPNVNAGDTIQAFATNSSLTSVAASSLTAHTVGHSLEDHTPSTVILKWVFIDCFSKSINLTGSASLFLGGRIIGV